ALFQIFTSMLVLNPPEHTRLRRLVSGQFTARRVRALQPAVQRLTGGLLDRLEGEADFIDEFAFPLPVNVIGELLGIPAPDRGQFQHLVRAWTEVFDCLTEEAVQRADRAAVTIRAYLADLVADRLRHPGTDLLSALVAE